MVAMINRSDHVNRWINTQQQQQQQQPQQQQQQQQQQNAGPPQQQPLPFTRPRDTSMSRERSSESRRERDKRDARKIREQQAAQAERESRQEGPVFRTARRSPNSRNTIESILGNFESFKSLARGVGSLNSVLGVDHQPPTPAPARQPIHDPSPPPQAKPSSDARSSSKDNDATRQTKRSQHPQKSGKVLPPHGPGPGPGGGPGGGRGSQGDTSMKPPPLRMPAGQGTDTDIKHILEEMTIKPPLLSALQTPRPDHLDQVPSVFPFTPITPLKDTPIKDRASHPLSRKDKTPDLPPSRSKSSKPLRNSSGLSDHLHLSEDSDDGGDSVGNSVGFPPRPSAKGASPASGVIGLPQPLAPLKSPAASKENGRSHSPKTSEDSTDDDESESDSESSSSEEEPQPSPPASPKPQEDTKSSSNSWTLSNFLPRPDTTTQSSSQDVSPRVRTESASPTVAVAEQQQQRGHPSRSKTQSGGSSSHHRSPRAAAQKLTPKDKPKPQLLDTSDDETPTPSKQYPVLRTTPNKYASQELKTKVSDIESEEESKTRTRDWKSSSLNNLSSKSNRSNTISPRRSAPPTPRETPPKLHKRELGRKLLDVKSKSMVSSDGESDIDVTTVSPDMSSRRTPNSQNRHTPQRTPKESLISPLKIPNPVSPLLSVKKNRQGRQSANLGSESDDVLSPSEKSHNKLEVVNISKKIEKAKEPVAKPVRKIRDANADRKSISGSGQRDRSSEKSDKERRSELSDSVESRLDSVGASPLRQCVPKNTVEPKVPIPKVQYVKGNPVLECNIPLNLINEVPKMIASITASIKSPYKSPVKEEDKTIVKEEIRTTGKSGGKGCGKGKVGAGKGKFGAGKGKHGGGKGKGKRKNYDPDTSTEDDSKSKVLSSIFINKRVAAKTEQERDVDKVKLEVKSEPADSDVENRLECKDTKQNMIKDDQEDSEINTSSTRQRHNSTSSHSSSRSSSRPPKKKKEKHSESSRGRKRNLNDSHSDCPVDYGGTNSRDGFERRTRDTSAESERSSSRKRDHDTSGESQRSRKKAKYMSPSVESHHESAAGSGGGGGSVQTTAEDDATSGSWDAQSHTDKENSGDVQHNSSTLIANTSSQSVIKVVKSDVYEGPVNIESGIEVEKDDKDGFDSSLHSSYNNKVEDMGTTPSAESGGYHSLPASEHESRSSSATAASPAPSYTMVPPQSIKHQDVPQPPPNSLDTSNQAQNGAGAIVPPPSYKNYFERNIPHVSRDHMGYLVVAKQLKHNADKEDDRCWKAVKYLDAVLYFILSGISMEAYEPDINTALTMYQETLRLIKWVSSMFKKDHQEKLMQSKLNVISLRCQSLLSMWCYKVGPTESATNLRQLQDYWNKHQENQKMSHGDTGSTRGSSGWNNQTVTSGSPSTLSQTPSPAGSVGSEGSQSSGYTSSAAGDQGPVATVPVPVNIHSIMMRYHQQSTKLSQAYEMWAEADNYINSKPQMKEFFIELEECHGPLTLHSTLHELFFHVQGGLQRIKTEWQHKVSGISLQPNGGSGAKLEES